MLTLHDGHSSPVFGPYDDNYFVGCHVSRWRWWWFLNGVYSCHNSDSLGVDFRRKLTSPSIPFSPSLRLSRETFCSLELSKGVQVVGGTISRLTREKVRVGDKLSLDMETVRCLREVLNTVELPVARREKFPFVTVSQQKGTQKVSD